MFPLSYNFFRQTILLPASSPYPSCSNTSDTICSTFLTFVSCAYSLYISAALLPISPEKLKSIHSCTNLSGCLVTDSSFPASKAYLIKYSISISKGLIAPTFKTHIFLIPFSYDFSNSFPVWARGMELINR